MSQIYSAASIYGIIDRMDAGEIQRWLDFHKRLKYPPRFINVFTAARFNEAPNLLRQVRDSLPNTIPVWRGYDGKDAWGNTPAPGLEWDDSNFYLRLWNVAATSARMAAGLWFNSRVKPYLNVIHETGAIVHLLNEATPVFNAAYETECIRLLGEEGIRAGAFAWAAGTPDWNDYQADAIEAEVAMAAQYDAVVMTHEYSGIKPEEQNSLINRNQQLVTRFDQFKLKKPDVFLGEFGLAAAKIVNGQIFLDANVGWRDMGLTEDQYMDFIKATAKVWYLPNKVSFSLYSGADWGNNGSFGVMKSQGLLDRLISASEWMSFSVETPTPAPLATVAGSPANSQNTGEGAITVQRPPEAKSGIRMKVKAIPSEYRNLRKTWNYQAEKTGELKPGDVVRRFDIPLHSGPVSELSTGNWIYVEKLVDESPIAKVVEAGYIWSSRITWDTLANSTNEVPVVTTPTPTPLATVAGSPANSQNTGEGEIPNGTAKRYSLVIKATDERHALIEKTLMALLTSVIYLGQVMGGVDVTLESEAAV